MSDETTGSWGGRYNCRKFCNARYTVLRETVASSPYNCSQSGFRLSPAWTLRVSRRKSMFSIGGNSRGKILVSSACTNSSGETNGLSDERFRFLRLCPTARIACACADTAIEGERAAEAAPSSECVSADSVAEGAGVAAAVGKVGIAGGTGRRSPTRFSPVPLSRRPITHRAAAPQ